MQEPRHRPPDDQLAVLDRATFLRGKIIQAYAHIEFMVTDLILRCEKMPEYAIASPNFPYQLKTKLSRLEAILAKPGSVQEAAGDLMAIVRDWANQDAHRHMMAHGILDIHFDRLGNHLLQFRLLRGKKGHYEEGTVEATLIEMHQTECTLTELADRTIDRIWSIESAISLPSRD